MKGQKYHEYLLLIIEKKNTRVSLERKDGEAEEETPTDTGCYKFPFEQLL